MRISLCRKVAIGALTLAGVGTVSSGAWASTVVDFSSPELGSQIDGKSSVTLNNVEGSGVDLTLDADPSGAVLAWDANEPDGVGIDSWSYEDDEIEGSKEKLTVSFSQEVELSDVYLVDLFKESKNWGTGTYLEQGSYQINGGEWVTFSADPSQTSSTDGYLTLGLDAMVTSIAFRAPGYTNWSSQDHDFAVKGLSFSVPSSSVPELDGRAAFGAVGLLFGGLIAGTSRRRKLHAVPGV